MYHSVIPPLVAGATTFPPRFGGAAKGKRLNGQARRLTSPHCGGPMQDLHSGRITRAYRSTTYEWNKIDNQHESKEL